MYVNSLELCFATLQNIASNLTFCSPFFTQYNEWRMSDESLVIHYHMRHTYQAYMCSSDTLEWFCGKSHHSLHSLVVNLLPL